MMKQDYYQLPEEDRERMTRAEMTAMHWIYSAVNSVLHGKEDLAQRLECIPNGKRRYNMMMGHLFSIANDLTGTIPEKQRTKIRNIMNDMEIRLVPKMMARDVSVVMTKEDAMQLLDYAKAAKCAFCTEDNESCRKCPLYRIMEAEVPLEKYDGFLCPYNLAEWEE